MAGVVDQAGRHAAAVRLLDRVLLRGVPRRILRRRNVGLRVVRAVSLFFVHGHRIPVPGAGDPNRPARLAQSFPVRLRGIVQPVTERRVSLDDLGAWLIKGNADQVDLAGRFAREPIVRRWCVQPSYRTRLMRAGQPVVFWASGSRGRMTYGLWGIGALTGEPQQDPGGGRPWVPLDLVVWEPDRRVGREEIRADGRLADLEVFRQPQGSNPSYLTMAQFAALREHC
jgi:hypothetical protein